MTNFCVVFSVPVEDTALRDMTEYVTNLCCFSSPRRGHSAERDGRICDLISALFFSVPVEDTALREMAEYMEANKDEILDKLPDNRNVTLLVFREGDQLSFFRVMDRGDGTLTPLSESLRCVSAALPLCMPADHCQI
jgi:hypothetical protein